MAISTKSIIHYTKTYKALSGILQEGFKMKYCFEKLDLISQPLEAYHPMISFCDIPLSSSSQHFKAYGNYGIGLTKEWAIRNHINPVIYIDKNSSFASSIERLLLEVKNPSGVLTKEQKLDFFVVKSFSKNSTGHLKRKGVDDPNYGFYDEREWRFIPAKEDIGGSPISVPLSKFKESPEKHNGKISKYRIEFLPGDISYIIVNKTTEIPKVIKMLRLAYSKMCTADDLDILFSKICSTQQIIDDY